jgi:DNA-binding NtrC family response regulator
MLQDAKLLIVDDEKAMRVSLAEIFTLRGAQVMTAADGREAVELLNQRDFDLMLLDLKMPGMSGIQVLEVAQKVRPGTVVILLTAHATLDSAICSSRVSRAHSSPGSSADWQSGPSFCGGRILSA